MSAPFSQVNQLVGVGNVAGQDHFAEASKKTGHAAFSEGELA